MSPAATCSNGADFGRRVEVIIPIDDPTDPASGGSISTMTVGELTGCSPIEHRDGAGANRDRRVS